jgi:uncharacterized protein (TIGR02246 family)
MLCNLKNRWLLSAGVAVVLAFTLVGAGEECPAKLSTAEAAKIEAVHQAYSRAWLQSDEAGVLRLFTDDAVIMPHHGGEPRVGIAAIKAFWFPTGTPPTQITKFELRTDEIGGSGDFGYARGRFTLSWTSKVNGTTRTTTNAGTYLDILRKQSDGSWKITHHMWDDPVPQVQ